MNKNDIETTFGFKIIAESYYHKSGYSFSKIYFPYNSDKIFELLFPVFCGIRNYFEDIIYRNSEQTNSILKYTKKE